MSFFNSPDKFSFKDLLALAFQAPFFYVVWRALTSGACLEVLRVLVPLEGVIFGGYFTQEFVPGLKSLWQRPTTSQEGYYPAIAPEPEAPPDISPARKR